MTLKEDLERVATTLRSVTDHDVEVVIDGPTRAVYVNRTYNEALVIECELTQYGKEWHLTAMAWDRTHGVSDERWIGHVREEYVAGVAKMFLDQMDAQDDALEALLAQSFGPGE